LRDQEWRRCVRFPSRQDNCIGASDRLWPIAQLSAWKQSSIAKWTQGVEKENVEVPRQLHMLKSVIEDDGVDTEALYSEHASGIAILPHDHGQSSQMLRQKDRLIASDLRRHEASLPIRDHCNAWLGSSTVTTT